MPRLTPKTPAPAAAGGRSPVHSGRTLILTTGCVLTLLFGAASLLRPAFVSNLDGRFYDTLIVADEKPPPGFLSPVVVALDDETLARYGRWPWPRTLIAQLMTRIAEQSPASVGVDIIFPEREPTPGSPAPPVAASEGGPAAPAGAASSGDQALARALSAAPFVLGFEMTFASPGNPAGLGRLFHPLEAAVLTERGGADPLVRLWQATGAIASRPEFARQAAGAGFVNAAMEQDGVLRRMPLLIREDGKLYPSLALASVLKGTGAGNGGTLLRSTWLGGRVLQVGKLQVPLDERGRLLLHYRGWHGSYRPVSAAALLSGQAPPDALRGRVVLLGTTATGMGEAVSTPVRVAPMLSGVQVHAIAAENLLLGDFVRSAPWLFRLLATLSLSLAALLMCAYLPVLPGILLLAAVAVGVWFGAGWLFHASGVLLAPALPLLALLGTFSLLSPIRLLYGEARERRQSRDLAKTREFIMSSLASLTEIRDTETGAHILRTQRYLRLLCQELASYPRYRHLLDPETIDLLGKLAPLHDIGKVGLPDHLLHKRSAFTPAEYEEVKKHAAYGRDTIAKAEARSGLHNDPLLRFAKELAYCHHERWDGSGYPERLKGEEIPWAGRVMAVADTYDALISRRVYKEPIPHETAVRIIVKGSGTLFDPDVVDAFTKVEEKWWQIARELNDPEEGQKKLGE